MDETAKKCRRVTQALGRNEPLKGPTLEYALGFVEGSPAAKEDPFYRGMATKLRAGQPLGEYEKHIMIDVLLKHELIYSGYFLKRVGLRKTPAGYEKLRIRRARATSVPE